MTELRCRCSDTRHSSRFASPITRILSFNTRRRIRGISSSPTSSKKKVRHLPNNYLLGGSCGQLLPTSSTTRRMACCCRCCSIISWPSCRRRHSAATSVTAPSKYNVIYQSFWLLGLLNNSPWVLMLAVATNISSGGVALVVSCCSLLLLLLGILPLLLFGTS